MSLYRIDGGSLLNNDIEARKVWVKPDGERTFGHMGRLVEVEPTDRICVVHVALVGLIGAYCKDAFPATDDPWVKCRMVDVVRIDKENDNQKEES